VSDLDSWTCDALLADGGAVHVRPITPADDRRLRAFHGRLSAESVYLRFFSVHPQLTDDEVTRFTTIDAVDSMAFVATLDDEIVAVARYNREDDDAEAAEVAFVVDDVHQGRGLGTLLLEHLAGFARTRGIHRFVADTLAHNQRMLHVFRDAGFAAEKHLADGVVRVSLAIEPSADYVAAALERDQRATVNSIERLLCPRSVAVIGAGRRRGTIGHEIFRNLLAGSFAGPVYPINPTASHVASVRAYPSVADVPDDVDVAVIVVPAPEVHDVIAQCAAKRVHGLVVITAGFAETGTDGAGAERALVALARGSGMRIIGPNCMGIINTAAGVSMNATFAPIPPRPGRVAFSSQSGGLGIATLEEAARLGIGVSSFVSVGNKADVSGNDLLQFWEADAGTDVILLYLESFGNPRKFSRVARKVSRTKPIVAVKSGRTSAGTRAASSHTAALASPDAAVDALFHQTGVIRVDTLEELFAVAQVLSHQPLPSGRRVAIVGNAGGPGILAADACEGAGLEVPELTAATQDALRSFLPAAAGVRNPVDMVASASAADYRRAIETVLADADIDAVLTIFTPPLVTQADDVARAVAAAAQDSAKPVLANFLAMAGAPEPLRAGDATVPAFAFPETAARALAAAVRYSEWRQRAVGSTPDFDDIDAAAANAVVAKVLAERPEGGWVPPVAAAAVLTAYGIPFAETVEALTADDAVAAATQVGYPVAVKAGNPELLHKTEAGAVAINLRTSDEVRAAYQRMAAELGDELGGVIVQRMAGRGVETIVGAVQDPAFGPLVLFGSGGTAVELFADRALRVLPLTDVDAAELVRSIRGAPLLFGYRGAPPTDVAALEDLLLRVARLVDDVPELAEMDLNPVIVSPSGAIAVDVRMRVAPRRSAPDLMVRQLR
jgi:acetyl coenzyme A synthetase (ADP forming)-like protein